MSVRISDPYPSPCPRCGGGRHRVFAWRCRIGALCLPCAQLIADSRGRGLLLTVIRLATFAKMPGVRMLVNPAAPAPPAVTRAPRRPVMEDRSRTPLGYLARGVLALLMGFAGFMFFAGTVTLSIEGRIVAGVLLFAGSWASLVASICVVPLDWAERHYRAVAVVVGVVLALVVLTLVIPSIVAGQPPMPSR